MVTAAEMSEKCRNYQTPTETADHSRDEERMKIVFCIY